MRWSMKYWIVVLGLLAVILSACTAAASTPTSPPATDTPVPPTATTVPPTPEPPPPASESLLPEEEPPAGVEADFDVIVYQGEDLLGGRALQFSDMFAQEKPVVLSMWAGLCPACHVEMPELQEAYETYGDRVLFFGLDIGPFVGLGSREDGLALLDELEITYPAGTTSDVGVLRSYKILGTPATVFLKPNGEIVEQWNGLLTGDQLDGYIEALIEASANS